MDNTSFWTTLALGLHQFLDITWSWTSLAPGQRLLQNMGNTRLLNLPASGNHQLLDNASFWKCVHVFFKVVKS
jgi:hypothetical protein